MNYKESTNYNIFWKFADCNIFIFYAKIRKFSKLSFASRMNAQRNHQAVKSVDKNKKQRDKYFFLSSLHSIISDLSSSQPLISVVRRNHLVFPLPFSFISRTEHVHLIGVLEFPLSRYDLDLSWLSRRTVLSSRDLSLEISGLSAEQ